MPDSSQSPHDEPDDEYREETLAELIARLKRRPPRPGMPPDKTFEELSAEQGTGPIDIEKLMALSPGPLYEGFEEDVRRMRSGKLPHGPKE